MDSFTERYLLTALWSSTDNDNVPLDEGFDIEDIDEESLKRLVEDCKDFQTSYGYLFAGQESRAGRDFWLTRNRHGAGFWDGDWPEEIGKQLTEASHAYGSVDLYVGDDGKIYCY